MIGSLRGRLSWKQPPQIVLDLFFAGATFEHEVEVYEYAPREIKQAVVGTGSASKEQVQHMVIAMLNLQGAPSPDAADALAAALCHGNRRRFARRLAGSIAVAGQL